MVEENEEIKEATKEVEKMSEDEKLRKLAFLREKAILDEKDIFRAGIDRGIEQEKIEIVKKMIKNNIDINTICEITGIEKEKIEEIKKSI